MSIKAKPIGERVLVDLTPAEQKTPGGIIIPETAQNQESSRTGTVIAKGDLALTVKKGDQILFGEHVGLEIKYLGKDYIVLKEKDILLII